METNYELKHKCLLVPLKAILLVLAMALFGFTASAQQGKAVRVANNEQLTEAMQNPAIGTIELAAGYYAYMDYQAQEGAKITKQKNDGGNREVLCTYYIIGNKVCFITDDEGYSGIEVFAGFSDNNLPPCNCCPTAQNLGTWTVTQKPSPTANYYFLSPTNIQLNELWVDTPGMWLLRYSWGDPWFSYVETPYYFYGPVTVDLEADDVCGTSTTVTFTLDSDYPDPFTDVSWTLNDLPYAGPEESDVFTLTVDECGLYILEVTVTPEQCPPVTEQIEIWFDCEPVAYAGPDANVCNDLCVLLPGSYYVAVPNPSFAWSWVNLSGPGGQGLTFNPQNGGYNQGSSAATNACRPAPPACSYGEYQVQLQVQNGECYDDDNAIVRYYQQPVALAGPDQNLCNTFAFTLDATPFVYCGTEGVNYWSEAYWEVVGTYPGATINFSDVNNPDATVTITSTATCPYLTYTFRWVEENSKPGPVGMDMGGCFAEDLVNVTIYEDPVISAGPDMVLCNTFAFSLYGVADAPCNTSTMVQYTWEKTAEPGNCDVYFYDNNDLAPGVVINNCDEDLCEFGKYTFEFTQCNGYSNQAGFNEVCCTTDAVDVWILQQPAADAGPDQAICYSFTFDLAAEPTDFCGQPGVNYFTWGVWEQVGGPASVTFSSANDPEATVTINAAGVPCPYGAYTFRWREYNGFGTPFQGCVSEDFVTVVIYETPEVLAGNDMVFCDDFDFQLDGTIDLPCTQDMAYSFYWELIDQPGECDVDFDPFVIDPFISIDNCNPCEYGQYIFQITQKNGYYNDAGGFFMVCEDVDLVSVWIYEPPTDISAGIDQYLCDDYTFNLTGTGADYCGDFGINYNNWYSWTQISGPCTANITGGTTLNPSVEIVNCPGECAYGEFKFRLTEYNGTTQSWCENYDDVSVYIFEEPFADAGDDINLCVDYPEGFPFCDDMTADYDPCYSMYGQWTKTCGPGNVSFEDSTDPLTGYCIEEPGRYIFTWTVWNQAEDCMAEDDVIFDLIEQPTAIGLYDELTAPCDLLCVDLGLAGIDKYDYYGDEWTGLPDDLCPNYWDNAYWSVVSGPGNVTFADDEDPSTDMCVSLYGCYTVRWNEVNKAIDGSPVCSSYFDVFVQFIEKPEPDAGQNASLCGNCYTMDAEPYLPENCAETNVSQYWMFLDYTPPVDACAADDFSPVYSYAFSISNINNPNATICVLDDCLGTHYGKYRFVWVNGSGACIGKDTVAIEFKKKPAELALEGYYDPSNCYDPECPNCWVDCLYPTEGPEEVMEVCANSCLNFSIDWDCFCYGGPIPGYTYEWSFIGPAGSYMSSQPYWYDCDDECWRGTDYVNICFGECCDTARLYLTITTPQGCTTTEEWKFYVNHLPCAEIADMSANPGFAEVGMVSEYCNVCPADYDMSCLLYSWTAEHCGVIQSGQGTECINVLWTDYNVNGGWGEINLTVYDTCTGCCNYDQMTIKVLPAGTLGTATLSGNVYYDNNFDTPLNGVEITLWNGGVPVMTTVSYNDVEGDGGMGYYEFTGINATTNFGLTASYDAPWYGANATDALAAELYWANAGVMPAGFTNDALAQEAMDVNNLSGINVTDALWIKQRAINMVTYFPAGDWAFIPMTSQAGVKDIPVLNMGDANRSNIPNSMKSMPAIDMITDGTMNVVTGQVFDLPIRIDKANVFGAMTLSLDFDASLIEVVEVGAMEGMVSNISDGNVSMAWSHANPMALADNDVVVNLKVKAIGQITTAESMFSIGINSEFADATAKVIEPVRLKTFGVTTGPAAPDYFLSSNRPNPFSTSTFIEYTLPESGKVKLSVLDMLGQELEVLVESTQIAGTYTVEYSAAGLATGVYLYKITVDGETRDFISTQRMVVSH